jgi:hypothetical protein
MVYRNIFFPRMAITAFSGHFILLAILLALPNKIARFSSGE